MFSPKVLKCNLLIQTRHTRSYSIAVLIFNLLFLVLVPFCHNIPVLLNYSINQFIPVTVIISSSYAEVYIIRFFVCSSVHL